MKWKRRTLQFLGLVFFRVSYPVYYKRKLEKTSRLRMFGFSLTVPPGVFHPGLFFTTRVFGKYLSGLDLDRKTVLEMGCGSGLLSMIVTSRGANTTSVDINPAAIECTRQNARANGLDQQMQIMQGNLFESIPTDSRFDLIIWNPPFFPGEPSDKAAMAWKAGESYALLKKFADQVTHHVRPDGGVLLLLTDKVDEDQILSFFVSRGFVITTVLTNQSFFETFTIYDMRIDFGRIASHQG